MSTRALLLCDGAPSPRGQNDPALIRERIDWRSPASTLNFSAQNLEDTVLGVVDGRAADLIQIAICAFAADQAISRGGKTDVYGQDWHRELHLAVPLRDPDFWSEQEVYRLLIDALSFATDDTWRFTFSTLPDRAYSMPLAPGDRDMVGRPDYVVLLSGGADSLCATVELLAGGQGRPLLISHRPTPPIASRQTGLIEFVQKRFPHQAPSRVAFWIHRRGSDAKDTSQRSRAFLYASLGVSAAAQLGLTRVVLADNGVVSLNLPINRGIVGTMASRSTHPGFLSRFNRLLGAIFARPPRVENPLALRTRAEVLDILKVNGCAELLQETVSCSHTRGLPSVQRQCGYCSQCIDRRFGVLAAGLEEHDLAERYKLDAFVDPLPEGEQRTVAVSYVRLANRLARMSPEEMFQEIQELSDAVDPMSPRIDDDSRVLGEMLKRHGIAVGDVMSRVGKQAIDDLGHGRLPETCLLRLAFGSALEQPPPGERETALPDTNLFRQEGKMWRIRFDGLEVSTPNEAGMTYIAHLLLNAWQDIHVFKLASLRSANRLRRESAHEDIAALGADGGSYDPVLDRSALESYRARLHELDAARKLAEQNGDQIGLAEIDREYAGTERELKRATGLGGRARTFQGEMGRARQRVSRAIDRARVTISKGHAPLGRHLDAFVSTGKHCAYKPEPPTHWSP